MKRTQPDQLIVSLNCHLGNREFSHERNSTLDTTWPSASSRETTRQVVCSLQLSDQISKFWLFVVSSLQSTDRNSQPREARKLFHVLLFFICSHLFSKKTQPRAAHNFFQHLSACVLLYFYVFLNESGRAQRRKFQNAAVRSLQSTKKNQVLEILNFVVYNRTCSLRDLSNSDSCSLQTTSRAPCREDWTGEDYKIREDSRRPEKTRENQSRKKLESLD